MAIRPPPKEMVAIHEKYMEGLEKYLISMVEGGALDSEKAGEILAGAGGRLRQGLYSPDLPYFQQVIKGQTYQDVLNEYFRMAGSPFAVKRPTPVDKTILPWRAHVEPEEAAALHRKYGKQWLVPGYIRRIEEERGREEERVRGLEKAYTEQLGEVAGTAPWKDWFRRQYPQLFREFKVGEEKPTAVGWAEFLKKRKPELREEWWSLGAYQRGERPAAFAPRIKTVGF